MIREIFLFIAYKACNGKNFAWGNNPFQYKNAIRLITVLFFLHIVQILLLFDRNTLFPINQISGIQYLLILGCGLLFFYLFEMLFSKKILAKGISQYKQSVLTKYAKLIAYGYLIINIGILIAIVMYSR